MNKLWARVMRDQKIRMDKTLECGGGTLSEAVEALGEICRELDIPRPIWLPKHEKQFLNFHRTSFAPADFVEDFPYSRLDIEVYDNDAAPRRAKRDPRIEA